MKYFKVKVILGHLGNGKGVSVWVYIKSSSIMSAIKKAQNIPGVKHGKLPLEAKEISLAEYEEGIAEAKYYEQIDALQNKSNDCRL